MNAAQLELEEQIKELKELIEISLSEQLEANDDWEAGYACGTEASYDDAIQRCEKVLETLTGVYTESKS